MKEAGFLIQAAMFEKVRASNNLNGEGMTHQWQRAYQAYAIHTARSVQTCVIGTIVMVSKMPQACPSRAFFA